MSIARVPARRENPADLNRCVAHRTGVAVVLAVLPAGSRPAVSQSSWVRTVEAHPDVGRLRADAARNLREVVWELARWADWHRLTSRPTWNRLRSAAGLARSSVAKWLAWLRQRDLLAVVEPGSTPLFRPGVFADGAEGNRAAVYLLCEPGGDEPSDLGAKQSNGLPPDWTGAVEQTRTPSLNPYQEPCQVTRTHAKPKPPLRGGAAETDEELSQTSGATAAATTKRTSVRTETDAADSGPSGTRDRWPLRRPARTRRERLALCERLREESPPLRAAGSARRLRHLLRPWLVAGWTARGLLYAIDHTPNGPLWPYAWRSVRELRNPAGWVVHRLRAWRDSGRRPVSDPYRTIDSSQTRPASLDTHIQTASQARAEYVSEVVAAIRAQLKRRPSGQSVTEIAAANISDGESLR